LNTVITGASGQDGIFLTDKILRDSKSNIYLCTRSKRDFNFNKLYSINKNVDLSRIKVIELDYLNFESISNFINDVQPNFFFNLMGPSSVKSFIENPSEMTEITNVGFENIINSLIKARNFCNFFQASSSEMYGYESESSFNESSKFAPNTAYAKAKHGIHLKTLQIQEKFNWNIVSGIMFNHESEFRNSNFLIMKLVEKAINIENGSTEIIEVPSLKIARDWTYAKEMCDAMYNLVYNDFSGSYVIGSGKSTTLEEIVQFIFKILNLEYQDYIVENNSSLRKSEPMVVTSNPEKIYKELGWKANLNIFDIVNKMYQYKKS
tara:strand:- start:11278 stop:12240 length:963 start_codon:yes stop_codon:yes gene_type:complete